MNHLILRYKIIIFTFFVSAFFIVFSNNASALTCAVRAGACNPGETPLLKMQALDNSHAGFVGSSAYNNLICCSEAGVTIGTNCAGNFDTFLKLSAADNAHVEKNTFANYSNLACISVDVGSITCGYSTDCNTYGSGGFTCLGEISGNTNAHIGDCGSSYTEKICCKYLAAAPFCGDGDCNGGETCATCVVDCGVCAPFCGDGDCNGGETCATCVADCGVCCVPFCPGGCADVGQSDGCSGTCPNNNGNACNDGNACTSGDVCNGGSCSGTAINCDDGNACTTDSCNPVSGCVNSVIPPSCTLTASPPSIDAGNSSLLEWTINCADSASIDNGIGAVSIPTGNNSVSPISMTSYTMTVTSLAGGTGTCAATVDINPICSLSASPPSIFLGMSSTLTWTTEYADSITINNGIGSVASNGSESVSPDITTDYILTATNPSGVSVDCAKTVILKPCEKSLIPCGRLCDDPATTGYNETDDCTLCHLILTFQLIMDFLFEIAAIIAALLVVSSGFMYILSSGKPELLSLAKTIFKTTLMGFALIFIAWIMVDTILTMFGFIDPLGDGNWHVMC